MILFLDDNPARLFKFKNHIPSAFLAATAEEMIELLREHSPAKCIFLDHDLGGKVYVDSSNHDTGMEVVRWILENKPKIERIIIHTLNDDAGYLMVSTLISAGYKAEYIPFSSLDFRKLYEEYGSLPVEEE